MKGKQALKDKMDERYGNEMAHLYRWAQFACKLAEPGPH